MSVSANTFAPLYSTPTNLTYAQRRSLAAQAKREIKAVKANIEAARCQLWRAVQESQLMALTHRLNALTAPRR